MEKTEPKKVFVNLNQVWEKAKLLSSDKETGMIKVQLKDDRTFEIDSNKPFVEIITDPAQKFSMGDLKQKLEGEYISFDKLPKNVKDSLSKGKEHLYKGTYIKDDVLRETVKMIQLRYDDKLGSKLNVQYKSKEAITKETANSRNYNFAKEFDKLVNQNEHVMFEASDKDGVVYQRLAYYEPKLNAIRDKPILTSNTYFAGQKLTESEAQRLNSGEQVSIERNTNNKRKIHLVSYNPRKESFKVNDQAKVNEIDATSATVVVEKKKNSSKQKGISI